MNAIAQLLAQRSQGAVTLHIENNRPWRLTEAGSAKLRLPVNTRQAYVINTSGGLAGGDQVSAEISVGANSQLAVTSQAAERVYRSLGPPAQVEVRLSASENATLHWLPQETILFDGASLARNFHVSLHPTASFLAVEALVLGRQARGETISTLFLKDRWRIHRGGALFHADELLLQSPLPHSAATLGNATALATLIYIAPDAEHRIAALQQAIAGRGAASAWNGKLIARFLAPDGFHLHKALVSALSTLAGHVPLTSFWAN